MSHGSIDYWGISIKSPITIWSLSISNRFYTILLSILNFRYTITDDLNLLIYSNFFCCSRFSLRVNTMPIKLVPNITEAYNVYSSMNHKVHEQNWKM